MPSSSIRRQAPASSCPAARVAANSRRRSSVVASARSSPSARAAASRRSSAMTVASQRLDDGRVLGDSRHRLAEHVVGGLALGERPQQAGQRRPAILAAGERRLGAALGLLQALDDERREQVALGGKLAVDAAHARRRPPRRPRASARRGRRARTPRRPRAAAARASRCASSADQQLVGRRASLQERNAHSATVVRYAAAAQPPPRDGRPTTPTPSRDDIEQPQRRRRSQRPSARIRR